MNFRQKNTVVEWVMIFGDRKLAAMTELHFGITSGMNGTFC